MIAYTGSPDDSRAVIQFLRRELPNLRALRAVRVHRDRTLILDVNLDGIEFPGLTFGSEVLEEVLRELGVVFDPGLLRRPDAAPDGVREFRLSARWPWGEDRVM